MSCLFCEPRAKTSQRNREAIRRMLPGTLVFIRWADGTLQQAMRVQDTVPRATGSFIFLEEFPRDTVLNDGAPLITVDEEENWALNA